MFDTLISLAGHCPHTREYSEFSRKMESDSSGTSDEQAREASGREEVGSPVVWH